MSDAISIRMRQNSVAGSQNPGGIGGGGGMDDVLRRVGNVESLVSGLAVQMSGMSTRVDVIATKVDALTEKMSRTEDQIATVSGQLTSLTAQVSGITAQIPHLARKEDVLHVEIAMLRWLIGTIIAAMSLVFVIARFVQ